MKHTELQSKYRQVLQEEHGPRQIGRYYASELGSIFHGWLKPEDFFKEKEYDATTIGNIDMGEAMESHLNRIYKKLGLEYEHEPKRYLRIGKFITGIHDNWSDDLLIGGHFTIAVKPDFVFKDFILETKCPTERTLKIHFNNGKIPYWYLPQLESESRAFGHLPVCLGAFRDETCNRFSLQIIEYKLDDELWEKVIEKVVEFHKQLRKLSK